MAANRMRDLLAAPRGRGARIATVLTYSPPDDFCTVLLAEGEFPASVPFHVISTIDVGTAVTILPVGETFEVISAHTSVGGPGGTLYGPELLPNNGFEYGVGSAADHWAVYPWAAGDVTYGRDTTAGQAISGDARMLVGLNPGPDAPFVNVWSEAVMVDAGTDYQAAVWTKASAVRASLVTDIYVIAGDSPANTHPFSSGTTLTGASVASPGAAYQLLPGTVTIPAGLTYARVFLRAVQSAAETAVTVSWDEASLRQRITS